MAKKHLITQFLLVLLYFTSITLLISYPLIFHIKDYLFGLGDELLITWIMNWDIYAFIHQPFDLYQANIFHPFINPLTYSDAFITNAIFAFLPTKIFGEPVVAYNVNYLLAHMSLGFCTFLLVWYLTKHIPSGIIGGTLMSFSTYTVTRYVHLQVLSTAWLPLALFFFFVYTHTRKFRYLVFCAIAFSLQAANSFQPAYFLAFLLAGCVVRTFIKDKKVFRTLLTKRVVILFLSTLFFFFLLGMPYLQTSRSLDYVRDIRDTINFANRQEYILYPSDRTRLHDVLINTFYRNDTNPLKHDGYLGFMILLLGTCAIVYRIRKRKKFSVKYFDLFLFMAFSSYILSLGPALQYLGHVIKIPFPIPLPYALFYYVIPGFNGFRNSARWELVVVLCLSVAIGLLLSHILKHMSKQKQSVITVLICLAVVVEIPFPFQYKTVPRTADYPAVYNYISSLPANTVIVELPIYNWNSPNAMQENMRLLYSTKHHKKMINGVSGFSPPQWQEHVMNLYFHFPDEKTISYLRSINVTHVIVHKNEFDTLYNNLQTTNGILPRSWDRFYEQIQQSDDLLFVKKIGNDYVYTFKK